MNMIDADAHVEESAATWEEIEPAFKLRKPVAVTLPADTFMGGFNAAWAIDGQLRYVGATPTSGANAQKKPVSIPAQELTDVGARLKDMDKFGIQKQVIYPTVWLVCLAEEKELEAALARAWNTFMAKRCKESGGRLFYSAVVPFRSPQAAVEEIKRVKQMGGAVSLFVRGIEWDMPLSHPSFYPIYQEAEKQDIAIAVHLGFGSPVINRMFEAIPRAPSDMRFPFVPPRSLPLLRMMIPYGFETIVTAALPDQFPKLRWAFLEAASAWIVSSLGCLKGPAAKNGPKYIAEGKIFITCEPDEDLRYIVDKIGPDVLVMASDYPHEDDFRHDDFGAGLEEHKLGNAVLEKILYKNPARLYALS
jgi:predicted TIM-barrel fold metal-dependent hydrolase